ncbi:hypothetical protein WMY93_026434 [Mugilogobius chulae]|uniref:Uncharacterized protein n=1 Tax=Mugilogobius chulae TaxID=88201 RepID=A0AAW0N7H5_9GOBI
MAEPPLSSVNVVLVMAYGSLVFVLLFIFMKRQIMRFAMKSRRGPHAPIGHNAPKELRQLIETKLCQVQKIHFEPRLLSPGDDRLTSASCDYKYRMRALDAIRDTAGWSLDSCDRKEVSNMVTSARTSHCLFQNSQSSVIDTVLEGYNKARHGSEAFGEAEFLKYQEALTELASIVKSHNSSSSASVTQHQTAAKDLTSSTEPTTVTSPTQSTSLMAQRKGLETSWSSRTSKTTTTHWTAHFKTTLKVLFYAKQTIVF